MASKAEQILSRSLRSILAELPDGAAISESAQFREVLSCLERYVPEILAEIYPDWQRESLDDVYPGIARKTRDGEAEILGYCCLISDQALTPLHVHLQVAASDDEISWLECRLGEAGECGMVRTRWSGPSGIYKLLHALEMRSEPFDWVYKATFGQRRP